GEELITHLGLEYYDWGCAYSGRVARAPSPAGLFTASPVGILRSDLFISRRGCTVLLVITEDLPFASSRPALSRFYSACKIALNFIQVLNPIARKGNSSACRRDAGNYVI